MNMGDLRESRKAKLEAHRKERYGSVIASADAALKSAFLVNGGGAVALLAYFSQASTRVPPHAMNSLLRTSLLILVIGTACAGLATGLSFLAQYGYLVRRSWFGRRARYLTATNIVLVAASYLCFVIAGIVGYFALA